RDRVGQRDASSNDLVRAPAHETLECGVATLHRVVLTDEHHSQGRRVEDGLHLGAGLPQLGSALADLDLELVASLTKLFIGAAEVVYELRTLKCDGIVISRIGE